MKFTTYFNIFRDAIESDFGLVLWARYIRAEDTQGTALKITFRAGLLSYPNELPNVGICFTSSQAYGVPKVDKHALLC